MTSTIDDFPEVLDNIEALLDSSKNKYVIGQRKRIKLSIRYAKKYDVVKENVLDIGGYSGGEVRDAWAGSFPDSTITATDFDLHEKFPYADAYFDGAICGEIFEHIGDPGKFRTSVRDSCGGLHFLIEVIRVLKPGGRCILTTPNACSFKNIALAMCNVHPFMYHLHYREYTNPERVRLIAFAGAHVIIFDTNDVFRQADDFVVSIKKFCEEHKLPMNDRGNDHFVIFERPTNWSAPEIPNNTAHIVYPNNHRGSLTRPWMPGETRRYQGEV